jgi:hypothetical protein
MRWTLSTAKSIITLNLLQAPRGGPKVYLSMTIVVIQTKATSLSGNNREGGHKEVINYDPQGKPLHSLGSHLYHSRQNLIVTQ